MSGDAFTDALLSCIRTTAEVAAYAFPEYGSGCFQPTHKVDVQARVLRDTLEDIHEEFGYTGALWCAFYTTRMTGAEYNPNDPQPNNPHFTDWYETILCPWDLNNCGAEQLGMHGEERHGVPVGWSSKANWHYQGEPRRTMSCGLCGYLHRTLGRPPFVKPRREPTAQQRGNNPDWLWGNNWDMHPFGAWLANNVAIKGGDIDKAVANINKYRATNGEEIHGFAWQSLRLLAYGDGPEMSAEAYNQMLAGIMPQFSKAEIAPRHMMRVCGPSWHLSAQSRDDCSHGVGHGMFYFFWDIGLAQRACWDDELVRGAPGWMTAKDVLRFRWLCSSGIYHSAGNTISNAGLQLAAQNGMSGQEFLCKRATLAVWGDNDPHFERCVAGLGMEEVDFKQQIVKEGKCDIEASPAPWELKQHQLPTQPQRLTCNPANDFGIANEVCPKAFWAYFPCINSRADYKICQTQWHLQCNDDQTWYATFDCGNGHRRAAEALLNISASRSGGGGGGGGGGFNFSSLER